MPDISIRVNDSMSKSNQYHYLLAKKTCEKYFKGIVLRRFRSVKNLTCDQSFVIQEFHLMCWHYTLPGSSQSCHSSRFLWTCHKIATCPHMSHNKNIVTPFEFEHQLLPTSHLLHPAASSTLSSLNPTYTYNSGPFSPEFDPSPFQ